MTAMQEKQGQSGVEQGPAAGGSSQHELAVAAVIIVPAVAVNPLRLSRVATSNRVASMRKGPLFTVTTVFIFTAFCQAEKQLIQSGTALCKKSRLWGVDKKQIPLSHLRKGVAQMSGEN